MANKQRITLALTGASGAPYGLRLLQQLIAHGNPVHLLLSRAAEIVINTETPFQLPQGIAAQQAWFSQQFNAAPQQLTLYDKEDWFAPAASGSGVASPLVICPCSGGTLAAIAQGNSNNLIERAADVALKERRPLILVPRETPYSQIHLENMLKLTQMGALILPASPGFYQNPQSLQDIIDFIVARILSHLNIPQTLLPPWGE